MSLPRVRPPPHRIHQQSPPPEPRRPRPPRRPTGRLGPSPSLSLRPRPPPRLPPSRHPSLPCKKTQSRGPVVRIPAPLHLPSKTTVGRTSRTQRCTKTNLSTIPSSPRQTPSPRSGIGQRLEVTSRRPCKCREPIATYSRVPLLYGTQTSTGHCQTVQFGAKQEAEVLYTATAFVGLQLNRIHEFLEEHTKTPRETRDHLEEHPKTPRETRDHLEACWLFNLGIYEFLLARLDIIEGLQGGAQAQALAEIQQARVRPLLGRGSISAETYQIYLPADTRAKVAAATSRKPRHTNNSRGSASAGGSKTSTKPKNIKSNSPGTNRN
jgi:hypothetical protein